MILAKDYIRYKLTGEIGTDLSDASRTLCFDVKKRMWASDIMEKMKIEKRFFQRRD